MSSPGQFADAPRDLIPAECGHGDVQDQYVWPHCVGHLKGLRAAERGKHRVAAQFQKQGKRYGRIHIVIGNEDALVCDGPPAGVLRAHRIRSRLSLFLISVSLPAWEAAWVSDLSCCRTKKLALSE